MFPDCIPKSYFISAKNRLSDGYCKSGIKLNRITLANDYIYNTPVPPSGVQNITLLARPVIFESKNCKSL